MVEMISRVNEAVSSFVWGTPALILFVGTGILLTLWTKAFQLTYFRHWMQNTLGSIFTDKHVTQHTDKEDTSISQFQSMCTALAATLGTGNIVGVASALVLGGPGAVFWMWVVAFFGMMTSYAENVLGTYFRNRDESGRWHAGAMYYLRDGFGSMRYGKAAGAVLAVLFSLFCLLASFGIGNMSQVNAISGNLYSAFKVPKETTGIVLMALIGLVILGGIKRIASVTEKLVPFMAVAYIAGALVICILNIGQAGAVFASIWRGAFGLRAAGGGIVGFGLKTAAVWGMKRGIFSNEAGLGSSVMAHSNSNVSEPSRQGMWGIFEVFADTIVVCTMTAFVVLSSGIIDLETGAVLCQTEDAALVGEAFAQFFGEAGPMFIAVSILLFAFATVIGWNHYGAMAVTYLFGEAALLPYRIVSILFVFVGATINLDLAWSLSDTFNGLMALPNLIGVLLLSPIVLRVTDNYIARRIRREKIRPMLSAFPEIQREQEEKTDR